MHPEDATTQTPATHGRLLAKLVRVLLARERFETVSDLTEALKRECARLKIQWTHDDVNEAFRLIESNRRLTRDPRRRT